METTSRRAQTGVDEAWAATVGLTARGHYDRARWLLQAGSDVPPCAGTCQGHS